MSVDIKQINHTIIKLLVLAAGIFLLIKLQFVFIVLLVSFMLTIILLPFVRILHKAHIPAIFAVFLPLAVFVGLMVLLGIYVAPEVREQSVQFAENVPNYLASVPFADNVDVEAIRSWFVNQLNDLDIRQLAITLGTALFSFFFAIITILVITVYWLSDYPVIKRTLISYLPDKYHDRARDIWLRIENKLGKWFLGQIMISSAVGITTWLAALALGLPYAAVLGVLAAVLEIVPTIGPILAAIPAILLGATVSPGKALIVAIVYIGIQQIESHLITPLLMGRRVRLHPIVIIAAFLIGSAFWGILGALLSVPVAIMASAAVDSFRREAQPEPALPTKKPRKNKN
jgi:predicted PurR-regulated permease PerM